MLREATQDAKDATREAREVLKDMSAERKRIEELVDRLPQTVDGAIGGLIAESADKLRVVTEAAMQESVDRITDSFNTLSAKLHGEIGRRQRRGDPTLTEIFEAVSRAPAGLPVEITFQHMIEVRGDEDDRPPSAR